MLLFPLNKYSLIQSTILTGPQEKMLTSYTQVPADLYSSVSSELSKTARSPEWCGSVGWVSSLEAKGRQFDSQSEHMPGLQIQSLVGEHMRGNRWMFLPSLSPYLPLFLNKNKIKKKKQQEKKRLGTKKEEDRRMQGGVRTERASLCVPAARTEKGTRLLG